MMTTSASSKGPDLEEALKAYFWQAGYFVVRGLPFRMDDDDITDVDLWLYERPAALTRRRLIVDVKNKKSPKATERIIWSKGLQEALRVDGVIVATTDQRQSAKRLAGRTNVVLLDGEAVSKLLQSEKLKQSDQIRSDELDAQVKAIDESRRSNEWRQMLYDARSALLSGFGVQSANQSLRASGFFAEQAALAQACSQQANVALRLFYLTSSFSAVSLDFVLASHSFQSQDERRRLITHGIRFGHSEALPAFSTVRAAIGLVRQYLENGSAIAKQIEIAFDADANRIPAEMIADYVARISTKDALFNVAREVEKAAYSSALPSFDDLSGEAKSLLGVFLDFNSISRERVATSWISSGDKSSRFVQDKPEATDAGPLFIRKKEAK
jgi:hypothetical protein